MPGGWARGGRTAGPRDERNGNATACCLDVGMDADGNGDGVAGVVGPICRLRALSGRGADSGVVDPRLGTMADRLDLVPNHISDRQPGFRAARSDPTARVRRDDARREDATAISSPANATSPSRTRACARRFVGSSDVGCGSGRGARIAAASP